MKHLLFITIILLFHTSSDTLRAATGGLNTTIITAQELLGDEIENPKKSSTFGNGSYAHYLKITYAMTEKPLYKDEILAARQVCIREMLSTHYAHSKSEVLDELTKILAEDKLLKSEKEQIINILTTILSGVYQKKVIQFSCANPEDCVG